jgi:hypothetical protein
MAEERGLGMKEQLGTIRIALEQGEEEQSADADVTDNSKACRLS